ncbi:hypothetical protein IFM89_030854 [Coptis chinensis]|uniref:RNase H type-1 domain-containing protein n=1 Tax=Coptis chinensis TaxID=261450 RepID=A0A835H049_9MAGN|nr:hypothetical protein IFM89_030854 [Coptis chinensis]
MASTNSTPPTTKINTYGASRGNPGNAGIGATYRNCNGDFLLVYHRHIGVSTSYCAECLAIVEGLEVAIEKGWLDVWIESDSEVVVKPFGTSALPWQLSNRWKYILHNIQKLFITSTWREANFSADQAANQGCRLPDNLRRVEDGKPNCLTRWEHSDLHYYRFS